MKNVKNNYVQSNGVRGGRSGAVPETGSGSDEAKRVCAPYKTKMECAEKLVSGLSKYTTSRDQDYVAGNNYAADFNSWLMATNYMHATETTKLWRENDIRGTIIEKRREAQWATGEGLITLTANEYDKDSKTASNKVCFALFKQVWKLIPVVQMINNSTTESNQNYYYDTNTGLTYQEFKRGKDLLLPKVQMETPQKESEQGDVTQSSDKQSNTIITRDQQEAVSEHSLALDSVDTISSSEPAHDFGSITSRWMPMDTMEISTSDTMGLLKKSWYLPEDLLNDKCAPNFIPFQTFYYGRLDLEFRLVVNANKFNCGKLLLSSKYDSYQADAVQNGYQSALSRNHVIIDMCSNNEGLLQVPFRYHRPWVRLVDNDNQSVGVRPSKYASLYLHILSPLTTGKDGATSIGARLFFRFKRSSFTGMTYRVNTQYVPSTQGFGIEDIITPSTSRALKEVLGGAERAFDQLGRSRNQDKPSSIQSISVVPHPRLNFPSGKGISDVVPLRVNPHTLTNYEKINCPSDEPQSYYDLARIWGVCKEIKWAATASEGQELLSLTVDPTARSYSEDLEIEFTPLEQAAANFSFWTGPIELRLDFVSNSFHTGTVQLSAEFGRKSAANTTCESSSTYTKIFHLGEQKSVNFRIPYIYDTVMRRTTAGVYNPYNGVETTTEIKLNALTVAPESFTRFKVRVINPLRPVSSAPQEIKIIVFMRAGKNFRMHGLKGVSTAVNSAKQMDNFPSNYPITTPKNNKVKRDTQDLSKKYPGKYHAPGISNRWNEVASKSMPRTQMDNGEKETQDETDDFNQGQTSLRILTNDYHMNFKDLLRRPTLLMWNVKCFARNTGGYFIPLQPPSRQMCLVTASTGSPSLNGDWAPTLSQTTAVQIMDMFRCWRGGMRYTIVATSGTKPFYVSLIPHSGVRIVGDHQVLSDAEMTKPHPVCGSNFTTELVIPAVNPSITVEAPYDTENTWTLTFDEDSNLNYSWRDKGDLNSGHLCITSHEDITFDVWWSAGDDFEIANFYGPAKTKWNGWAYRIHDSHARVQMDFRIEETATKVASFGKRAWKSGAIGKAALAAIPIIGTPLAVSSTVCDIELKVEEVAGEATNTMKKMQETADKVGISVEALTANLSSVVTTITDKIAGLVQGATIIYDVILDILVAWMEQSWRVVGIGIIRFITKIMGVGPSLIDTVMGYAHTLSNFLSNVVGSNVVRTQVETDHSAVYLGILAGLIGTITGTVINPRRYFASFSWNLLYRMTESTGVSYLVHVLNFVKSSFEAIKGLVMQALGYVSPQAEALRMLSESDGQIERFIREAQIVTSESNTALLSAPAYRRRFWMATLQAHQIQRLLCRIPTNCVSYQLSKLCADVIKLGNEKFMDLSASPVRFEPMVIFFEGPAGTGKSHMSEHIADKLLEAIGFNATGTEKVFYRTAGEKFWSGYRDQPVVIYDEWLNTTDSVRCIDQIAEMMKLKSTGVFIPEMAAINEKNIRGNPLLIIVCSNEAFPNNLSNYATMPEATLRRREVVFNVTRKPEFQGVNLKFAPIEQRETIDNYQHLEFRKYKTVFEKRSLDEQPRGIEDMTNYLISLWKNYYTAELKQVDKRMQRLPDYMAAIDGPIKLQDPFTLFYKLGAQVDQDVDTSINGYTHYEMLEVAMSQVVATLTTAEEPNIADPGPLIEWEDVPTCNTQIIGTIVSTIGWFGYVPMRIARATREQLLYWEEQINPQRTIPGSCCICLEDDIGVAYVCENSYNHPEAEAHLLCQSCYRSQVVFNAGRCPVCRHHNILPLFTAADARPIGVWVRMVVCGIRSLTWLCDKVTHYYNWRMDHSQFAMISDFLFSLARGHLAFISGGDTSASAHFAISARLFVAQWMASGGPSSITQGDWGEPESFASTSQTVVKEADYFDVVLNDSEIENLILNQTDNRICLHSRLERSISGLKIIGDKWRVLDTESKVILDIPLNLCSNGCYILEKDEPFDFYKGIFKSYAKTNHRELRLLFIRYYNDPTPENEALIPSVVKPTWIEPYVNTISSTWWVHLSDIWTQYKQTIIYIGAASAVLASLLGMYNLATSLTTTTANIQTSSTAGSAEASSRSPRRIVTRSGNRPVYFHSQMETPSVFSVVCGYVARNTFQITIMIDTQVKILFGTGLFNHYLLIPKHYVKEIRKRVGEGHKIYGHPILQPQLKSEMVLDMRAIIESTETDLAYLPIPPKYPIFKDIRKFIADDADFDTPITSEGILLANSKSGCEFMREIEVDILGIKERLFVSDQDNEAFEVRDVLEYSYSKPGVCGSLLLRENHQRPILSMHFAGIGDEQSGNGYGIILTKEALKSLVENVIVPTQFEDVLYESVESAKFVYGDDIHLSYYGTVSKDKVPYLPSKSKIVPSLIQGVGDLKTNMMPAILDAKDSRYIHDTTPLFEGVRKHGVITKDFDPEIVEKAGEALWDLWLSNMKPNIADPRELTDSQCVAGLDIDHYSPIDLKTSAGYPYNCNKQRTTKNCYVEVERDSQEKVIGVTSWDPQLREQLDRKRALRQEGIVPHTLFLDTLKDEKRLCDKAMKKGGTRVFCSSPFDYVIECRRYFMHFVAAFMTNRHDLMHAVGINPTSEEWTTLTNRLLLKSGKIGTIDYSNFGPGYNSAVAKKAYELIIRWTLEHVRTLTGGKLDERVLWCIVYECLQSMHICNNTVYQQGAGSPSGAFFTTIINTLVNILYILIAWELLTKEKRRLLFTLKKIKTILLGASFKKYVALYCFGDDGIFTVGELFHDVFNMRTITELFKEYNIVATDAAKTGQVKEWEELSEAQFLKRGFLRHPTRKGAWLSPLKWESVESCSQWIWKSENLKDATKVNATASIMEAYGHGPVKFKEFKEKVNRALKKKKIEPVTGDWTDYDQTFFDTGFEFEIDNIIMMNI